ncbi:hypothetical protein [Mycolicibacterium grossiae]|uniref:hypothetical protein n=1 Tax=Mycolicibacterium grossiae TaxID=1552759 RepID=UPI000F78704D|nr:hypothetical protein [Mycolicibacterium grossiae]QEM43530.1 hypothetical protein FZ046_00935 [Mycolicibacterium grossiae]
MNHEDVRQRRDVQPTRRTREGGEARAVSDALTAILALADLSSSALEAIAGYHAHDAPAAAAHVLVLQEALARTFLDWIGEWPS